MAANNANAQSRTQRAQIRMIGADPATTTVTAPVRTESAIRRHASLPGGHSQWYGLDTYDAHRAAYRDVRPGVEDGTA